MTTTGFRTRPITSNTRRLERHYLPSECAACFETLPSRFSSTPREVLTTVAFVPMAVMYPEADVPILQLSLKHGLDPHEHITVGRALAPLRDEGVLILGSGSSIHNVRLLGLPDMGVAAFDDWLHRVLVGGYSEARTSALIAWATAPMARVAHPREEHLLPLMVALGAAERDKGTRIYHDDKFFGTGVLSNFMFGDGS